MNASHLEAGDLVCVRTHRWSDSPHYELGRVAKRTKTSVTLEDGRVFSLNQGRLEVKAMDYEFDADLVELTDELRAKLERG